MPCAARVAAIPSPTSTVRLHCGTLTRPHDCMKSCSICPSLLASPAKKTSICRKPDRCGTGETCFPQVRSWQDRAGRGGWSGGRVLSGRVRNSISTPGCATERCRKQHRATAGVLTGASEPQERRNASSTLATGRPLPGNIGFARQAGTDLRMHAWRRLFSERPASPLH